MNYKVTSYLQRYFSVILVYFHHQSSHRLMILNCKDFVPKRALEMSKDICDCQNQECGGWWKRGEDTIGIQWVNARDAAKYCNEQDGPLTIKNCSTPNVNNVEVKMSSWTPERHLEWWKLETKLSSYMKTMSLEIIRVRAINYMIQNGYCTCP